MLLYISPEFSQSLRVCLPTAIWLTIDKIELKLSNVSSNALCEVGDLAKCTCLRDLL